MAHEILNQFDDPSYKYLVHKLQECPAYGDVIKYASLDPEYVEDLDSTGFAWPERRLFPIDTEDNAALSYLYAEKNAAVPEYVREDLRKVLDVYGVELPETSMTKEATDQTKSPYFLLPEKQRWQISDGTSVKMAAEALVTNQSKLSVYDRTQAATRLLQKSAEYYNETKTAVLDNPDLLRLAGATASDTSRLLEWVEAREMVSPEAFKHHYKKIAAALTGVEKESHDRESLIKVAEVLQLVDSQSGLDSLYGRTLLDPILTVFNTTKVAEATVDLAGTAVPMSSMLSFPLHHYEDIFGEDITPEITSGGDLDPMKIAQVISTMPRDLKLILRKQMGK